MKKWVPILLMLGCAHGGRVQVASEAALAAGTAVSWGKPVKIQFSSGPGQTLLVFDDGGRVALAEPSGHLQPVPFSDPVLEADLVPGGAAGRICALLRKGVLECVEPTRRLSWSDLPTATGVYAAGPGLCLRTSTGPRCFALESTALTPVPPVEPPQPPCSVRNGEAFCTGISRHGELGDGDVIEGRRTGKVALTHVMQAAVGRRHGCAVLINRHVACWGVVTDGPELFPAPPDAPTEQLPICQRDEAAGTESFDHRHPCDEPKEAPLPYLVRPVPLREQRDAVSLAISGELTCLLLESGDLECFGKRD